jgi:hypothetical protein
MRILKVLIALSAVVTILAESKGDSNQKEAQAAGLTMQAALHERKAAIAAYLVERYKNPKNKHYSMKKAHAQYRIEAHEWQKSQALIVKAATTHPLPNKFVAKAAVQEKVAIEAARVMKQKMQKEPDAAEKALDEKVYKIELHNAKEARSVLNKADALVKKVPVDRQKLKEIRARIAKEQALRSQIRAEAKAQMQKFKGAKKKALRSKLAQQGLTMAEKLAAIDVALNETLSADQMFDQDLYHTSKTLEQSGIGDDVKKEHAWAAAAEKDYHSSAPSQRAYANAWQDKNGAGWKTFKPEIQGNKVSL